MRYGAISGHLVVMYHMSHTELASTGVRIHVEDFVDDGVEVHEPGIFSQVVFWLAQKWIFLTIATMNCDFSRSCESPHDINVIQEICDIPTLGNPDKRTEEE